MLRSRNLSNVFNKNDQRLTGLNALGCNARPFLALEFNLAPTVCQDSRIWLYLKLPGTMYEDGEQLQLKSFAKVQDKFYRH